MKQLLKETLRLFGGMVLGGLLCMILSISLVYFDSSILGQIIVLLLSLVLYFIVSLYTVFELSKKDRIAVKSGRIPYNRFKGLYMGLLASVPHFLIFLAFVVVKLGAFTENYPLLFSFYKITNAQYINIIRYFLQIPVVENLSYLDLVIIFLQGFVMPVAAFVAYSFGYKDISLKDKIFYKSGKKDV